MISYVKGTLAEINPDSIVIDVSGIGWHIFVPSQALSQLPRIGETVKIHTWLQVREDAMALFGFLTKDDLRIFRLLLSVSGVGPKNALAILSAITTDDLRFAVLSSDAKTIAKAPGIGTKTAQRLILELKDKISFEEAFEQKLVNTQQEGQPPSMSGIKAEASLALTALGYSSTEALRALNGIQISEGMAVEELLKLALKNMSSL